MIKFRIAEQQLGDTVDLTLECRDGAVDVVATDIHGDEWYLVRFHSDGSLRLFTDLEGCIEGLLINEDEGTILVGDSIDG